jgi:DNA end-binding protein Ku
VRLYNAVTETQKIRLHKYDRRTGERIHYQNINEDGDVVEPEDIVKGYEYQKGDFVPVEDEELERLRIESKHTIDLVQFTPLESIDPIYFDTPYFIAPDGEIALEAYLTLHEALLKSGKVALGQVVLSNRERVGAIKSYGRGMIMETLRYNYEVRKAEDYLSGIKKSAIDKDQMKLAELLIESKSSDFDPSQFRDRYQDGLQEIINAKLEHRKPDYGKAPPPPGKVINIMDALKKSLEQSKRQEKAAYAAPRKKKKMSRKKD